MTTKDTATPIDRFFNQVQERVNREWRGAQTMLGERVYKALLCEEVLWLAASQDESVSAETVRKIVNDGWVWATRLSEKVFS